MEISSAALWLNEFFSGYDHAILRVMHFLADKLGFLLTPLMKIITFLGEKGIIFYLLVLIYICFADRRDYGVCLFGAVCCGALITNIILKDMVARPRPFVASEEFRQWWEFVGAAAEDDFSFPSGHVTSVAAGMTALTLMKNRDKKWIVGSVIAILVMMFARNYLIAHYPSDVLAGAIIGVFSGVVAWLITDVIFRVLEDHDDVPFCALALDFNPTGKTFEEFFGSLWETVKTKLGIRGKAAAKQSPDTPKRSPVSKHSKAYNDDFAKDYDELVSPAKRSSGGGRHSSGNVSESSGYKSRH